MKNFILKGGRLLIDFFVVIEIFASGVFSLFFSKKIALETFQSSDSAIYFACIIFLVLITIIILLNFFLYQLIGLVESLESIAADFHTLVEKENIINKTEEEE